MYMELFFIAFIAACLYFVYIQEQARYEGFATHAIDAALFPKCFLRSADAQAMVQRLSPFADREEYKELLQILQKVLCIDADVTGAGVGGYTTVHLPFATAHDIEPVGGFVGRCLRNAVKDRDIAIAFDKYRARGAVLIDALCGSDAVAKEQAAFVAIVDQAAAHVREACLRPIASMDTPAGVRDPGYFEPDVLQTQVSKY